MERIEVLGGAASVLYGQAPVGDILKCHLEAPADRAGRRDHRRVWDLRLQASQFDLTGRVTSDGKWSYRLTGSARDADTQVDYVDDDRYALNRRSPTADGNTTITLLGHFQRDPRDPRRSFSRTSARSSPTSAAITSRRIASAVSKSKVTGRVTENLKIIAGYSYTDAQYTGGDQAGFRVESAPKHLASLWGIYESDRPYLKGWSVGAGVRYVGSSWDGYDESRCSPSRCSTPWSPTRRSTGAGRSTPPTSRTRR